MSNMYSCNIYCFYYIIMATSQIAIDLNEYFVLKTSHSPDILVITFNTYEDYKLFIGELVEREIIYSCLEGSILLLRRDFDIIAKLIKL